MDKILTPEQVKLIREKYEPQERVGHYELRTLLLEVLDNYDAQGVQLADAQAALKTATAAACLALSAVTPCDGGRRPASVPARTALLARTTRGLLDFISAP